MSRPAPSPEGNRLWVVPAGDGLVVQKYYGRRHGPLRTLLTALARRKTGCSPAARRATEAARIALFTAHGLPVPKDRSAEFPWLASERVLVMEFVPAPPLGNILRERLFDRARRSDLLRRFAAAWGERHRKALAIPEPGLVQEHPTFDHVLVDGDRFVTIDLEQGFRPGRPVAPLVSKEVAGYLRTLWNRTSPPVFAADLRAIVEGYPQRGILREAVREYVGEPGRPAKLRWRLDARLRKLGAGGSGKYAPLAALAEMLGHAGG